MSRPGRILVTGASRGIGRAIAERLAGQGRQIAIAARDADALARIAASHGCAPIAVDLTREDGSTVDRAEHALGGALDGLVHAAGIAPHAELANVTARDLEACLDLHLRAPLALIRRFAERSAHHKQSGSVVLVASTLALAPAAGTLSYSASKAAQVAMAKVLALELAPRAIRVNAIAPGVVDTDMIRGRDADELRRLHPLGRLGTPAEIAEGACYLLDAEWATGSVLVLDGGLTSA